MQISPRTRTDRFNAWLIPLVILLGGVVTPRLQGWSMARQVALLVVVCPAWFGFYLYLNNRGGREVVRADADSHHGG